MTTADHGSERTRWGVLLPTFDPFGTGEFPVVDAAKRAEALGFDAAWVGDHLVAHVPVLDAFGALAAAAGVTGRVELGFSVLLLALRNPAWAAKQLSTLEHLAPGRVRLGVGVGGEYPDEFAAAGVDVRTRGARLDRLLTALPALLAGEQATPPDGPDPVCSSTLSPAFGRPLRVTVGGRSSAALRRCARFGEQWLAMWRSPAEIAAAAEQLRNLASGFGRAVPRTALLLLVNVDDDRDRARSDAAAMIERQYRLPFDVVDRWTATGTVDEVVRTVAAYRAVGVSEFVLMPAARDRLAQYDRLAEVRDTVEQTCPGPVRAE